MASTEPRGIMFAEPLLDILQWFKGLVPTSFKPGRPHFNFITVHYVYLIGMTILGSIIIYPSKLMPYIDALFFAAGSATQSGLNTIDVNQLQTYQQVTIMLIAAVCNPIFINTVVVFIRLYWFEKRFQGIVKEAARMRRTRTMSRTRSQAREDTLTDAAHLENGVNGKDIHVLHNTTKTNGMNSHTVSGDKDSSIVSPRTKKPVNAFDSPDSQEASPRSPQETFLGRNPLLRRDIVFADEAKQAEKDAEKNAQKADDERIPEPRSPDHHIAFLEKQRKQENGTLRIPGPRDFDRGDVPREVNSDDENADDLDRAMTRDTFTPAVRRNTTAANEEEKATLDANGPRKGIAFDVPDRSERIKDDDSDAHSTRFNPLRPFSGLSKPKRRISSTALANTLHRIRDAPRTLSRSRSQAVDVDDFAPYLSWQPTIGRNSAFVDLSEEQREELGGIEYRSLKTLAIILVCYYVGFHMLGMVILHPWIVYSNTWGPVVDAAGQNRSWWGVFTPASLFNDLGYTLTPDSMISFQGAVLPLLLGSFLIVIGNTGFPCMLRFVIWLSHKVVPTGSPLWEELRFLLDHPRRCFTLLFPSKATWWLFWLLVLLNGVDLLFFIILDLNDETVTALAPGIRVLVGWFQATATRTAGFAAVNLSALHPAIQVSYLVMMYISVFPIAISVRRTNVYEEKSLGVWGTEEEVDEESDKSYVGQHLRRQLSFDLWYIFLGLFIISIIEGHRIENTNDYGFTMFSILFEIVSAYGTVGLSLGYPGINASFSTEFSTLSKLVIIAMMLRGRHRGLPYALDRAILLPSEALHKKESEEAARRAGRRNSMSISKAPTDERRTLGDGSSTITAADTVGMGPLLHANTSPSTSRKHHRRPSELSQLSRKETNKSRGRTITSLVAAGLSAGPSSPGSFKRD
ncbi:cation transport protein-domain-containing protein [Elsinoe ampelina]|uniref:Potassium transport protein n=1 Tax=Elsinoe ampelina TaxID=302913 RepID=A0A6A6G4J5_9PEZI|nr:cation transport protein-domain-containing protein [Elsinoe ampelina]